MPIVYHQSTQTFHLYNETLSYIIKVLPSGHLGQLYYGKRIHDQENFDHLFEIAARAPGQKERESVAFLSRSVVCAVRGLDKSSGSPHNLPFATEGCPSG